MTSRLLLFLVATFPSILVANVIPDCPKNEGWACEWDGDFWKATSNASEFEKVIVTYEESPTRGVSIVCVGGHDDDDGHSGSIELPRGFLRNFTLGANTYFRFMLCPPPKELSLAEILEGQRVQMLRFTTPSPLSDTLDANIFANLTEVTYLSLTENSLTSIPSDLFGHMRKLDTVNLKNNHMTALPSESFKAIDNLVHLELGKNNLTRLDTPLEGLENLQTLNVYENKIESVSAEFFAATPSLRSVDLQGNLLETLPPGVFQNLRHLRTLRLFSNRLINLPADLLRPLQSLEHFDVSDNPQLTSVPNDLLQNLTSNSLTEVNLRRCGLRTLSIRFLDNCAFLRTLLLNSNNLTELKAGTFAGAVGLELLDLQRNRIESVPSGVFNALSRLRLLRLSRNRIRHIAPSAFYDMIAVTTLDLSRNQLSDIPDDLFKPTVNIESLNLGHNMLTNENREPMIFTLPHTIRTLLLNHNRLGGLPSAWITENTLLVHLDLTHNLLDHFDSSDCQPTSDNVTIDLSYNNISRVFVDLQWATVLAQMNSPRMQRPTVLLGHNPLVCDCLAANLLEYVTTEVHQFPVTLNIADLNCQTPPELASQPVSLVRLDQLVCNETNACPPPCECRKHAVGNVIEMDCHGLNLTGFPKTAPFNVSVLRLDDNSLTSIGHMNPQLWANLTELRLSGNNIETLDDLTWLPKRLQLFDMQNNMLRGIAPHALDLMDNVTAEGHLEVWLGDNPWRCDCGAKDLKEWLNVNGKRVGNLSAMRCHSSGDVDSGIPLYKAMVCTPQATLNSKEMLIGATAVSFVLAIALAMVGIAYYRYKREIKVWLYARQWCMWFVTESELDREKTYDAFISFSQEDSDFVASELLPGLEARSHHSPKDSNGISSDHHPQHPSYKVCIHYRDWLAGEWISDQIIRSVQDSRRTIVVLSKNFIKSVWGRLEFKAAHHQALQDRTNRIIMVVLGEIPPISEMDAELKMYVKFNTYLKWDDPWFWQKLRYAMPHRPLSSDKPISWSSTNLALSPSIPISIQSQITSSSPSQPTTQSGNSLIKDKLELVRSKE